MVSQLKVSCKGQAGREKILLCDFCLYTRACGERMSGWGKVTSLINKSAQTTSIDVFLPSHLLSTQNYKAWLIQAHVSPVCLDNKWPWHSTSNFQNCLELRLEFGVFLMYFYAINLKENNCEFIVFSRKESNPFPRLGFWELRSSCVLMLFFDKKWTLQSLRQSHWLS